MTPRLLVLTDRSQLPLGRSLRAAVTAVVAAGADHVVLREPDLAPACRAALVADLTRLGARVVAAHHPAGPCVGVHLAAAQPAADAEGLPFGRSCHTGDDLVAAAAEGAAWATLGPVAATASKPGYGPGGRDGLAAGLAAAFASATLPTYALGGVDATNAAAARAAGAHGVAVMGALMRARDPAALAATLLAEVDR